MSVFHFSIDGCFALGPRVWGFGCMRVRRLCGWSYLTLVEMELRMPMLQPSTIYRSPADLLKILVWRVTADLQCGFGLYVGVVALGTCWGLR
jgi:hypothetical protein